MEDAQIFILSPASCGGRRAELLLRRQAQFDLAVRLRDRGAPLGEVFSFLSGLYFRGKAAYAATFARPMPSSVGVFVITAGGGLQTLDRMLRVEDVQAFQQVPIDLAEPRYRKPLEQDAWQLADALPTSARAVLLGSIATDKYVSILSHAFGAKLRFPADFIGRGDMSRGGLLLRAVEQRRELPYIPLGDAPRRGRRPARLPPRNPPPSA